jgi:hypothetical protein
LSNSWPILLQLNFLSHQFFSYLLCQMIG